MIESARNYLNRYSISNCKVIIGLSGGPDSVTLLSILNELKNEFNLTLEAAYVNHGIRPVAENSKDFLLVDTLCKSLYIKLYKLDIPHKQIELESKKLNSSVEAVARDYRYEFFNTIAESNSYIAIGHNSDDQIETQIMRFFQGSSIDGLLGIKDRRDNIIRPLIDASKKQILKYLEINSIEYRVDYTNNQLDYLRNSIRHRVVPVISDIFPSYKKALKKIENELKEYKEIVDNIYKHLIWDSKEDRFITNYNQFIKLPNIKRREEIYNLFDRTFSGSTKSFRLPKRFLLPLNKKSFNNGEIILEGYGFKLERSFDKLIWGRIYKTERSFRINVFESGRYNNRKTFFAHREGDGVYLPGLNYPFTLRSYTLGYQEVKIIKKMNKTLQDYNEIIIVEKENHVYAIIYKKELLYINSSYNKGIYLNIIED